MQQALGGGAEEAGDRRRLGRRVIVGWGATVLAAGAAVGVTTAAGADAGPTQGSSYAQSFQVTPHEGSLAVGAVFGEALAGHTGSFARAQSQGLDLGAVGEAAQGYNCGSAAQPGVYFAVPAALNAESGQSGADQGFTSGPGTTSYPQQVASGFEGAQQVQTDLQNHQLGGYEVAPGTNYFANEHVLANNLPYGEADTTYAGPPVADPTGAISISGAHSKAWSGVVNGVTEAAATEDINAVSLGAGAVVLNGLHWEVIYPVNGSPTGSFTIGQVQIAGTTLPSVPDLTQLTTMVNQALGVVGLQLNFPASTMAQGIQFVSPLEIRVVPNTTRDSITQQVVTGIQPTYYQITNGLENGFSNFPAPLNQLGAVEQGNGQQLAALLCQSDTPITVADVTIASFDGGGYFNVALGGVNASAGPLPVNPYDLQNFGLGSLNGGSNQFLVGSAGTLGSPGSVGNGSNANGTSALNHSALNARSVKRGNATGTTLLAAALAGLGLLVLLVEGDRRLMRRALRRAPAKDLAG